MSRKRRAGTGRVHSAADAAPGAAASSPATGGALSPSKGEGLLRVTVVNGDLMFVREPLLLGHYRAMRLTGAEAVIDRLIGGTMSASLAIGHYPDEPGSSEVFLNLRHDPEDALRLPRPEAVIVVGLGEEGTLTSPALVQTVRRGVIAWAQRLAERQNPPASFDLAATLIGSGGRGVGVAQSAQLIAEGVREANERLAGEAPRPHRRWPRVGTLRIIELYLDRAMEAWRGLTLQSEALPGRYVVDDAVESLDGALRRPLESGYRGAAYDFISAVTARDESGRESIAYALDTHRARTEVTAQAAQLKLIRSLVDASSASEGDTSIGRTLFNLLVPVDLEPFLAGTTEMVIELDRGTAAIPWEMLDTNSGPRQEAQPWAIRSKLVRKLRIDDFRRQVADANTDAAALVVGEPMVPKEKGYDSLPGARREARAVATRLADALGPDRVRALINPEHEENGGPDAQAVLTALYDRPWRMIHLAGHGELPLSVREPRGVVLSNGVFLGPPEVGAMRVVPELVFVNCCYLGGRPSAQLLSHAQFAATVADELIRVGVRCVVAAGWAVNDLAAARFATSFYDAVLEGRRFIDAVAAARKAAYAAGGTTWAAYQCYGDPEWTFVREAADGRRQADPDGAGARKTLARTFAGVASAPSLKLALDTIAVNVAFKRADEHANRAALAYLEEQWAQRWGHSGEIAEAFGAAWAGLDRDRAITWYERALAAPDGKATFDAAEQLWNLQVRRAEDRASAVLARHESATGREDSPHASDEVARELEAARACIRGAIERFRRLDALQPTMSRKSLIGSACKRLALIEAAAGRETEEMDAIRAMQEAYAAAEQLARDAGADNLFYPALNRLVADLALHAGTDGWSGPARDAMDMIRASLAARAQDDPDFWSVVGETELQVYEALAARNLAGAWPAIRRALEDLAARAGSARQWGSVYDNARFLLTRYVRRVGPAERQAAQNLLDQLAQLANAAPGVLTGGEPARSA